jgi:hypothetical protein
LVWLDDKREHRFRHFNYEQADGQLGERSSPAIMVMFVRAINPRRTMKPNLTFCILPPGILRPGQWNR